jgi:hypothetical protein
MLGLGWFPRGDQSGAIMTDKHHAAEHHASATIHHRLAAQFHREASRHYETGKDYAHAAHQAQIAHAHALHALRQGDEARTHYAEHHLSDLTIPSDPGQPGVRLGEVIGAPAMASNSAAHHAAAGLHHEQAAQHHKNAARLCNEQQYARAAHEAQMAHRHAHYSIFHDDEAAMHHVEHYGKSGQSAEIL